MNVRRPGRIVGMAMLGFQRHHVEMTMAHAAFGDQRIGELSDIRLLPLENDAFQTMIVIEMGVHRCHRQIVMIMLQRGQALRQFAFVVVVNIGKIGDTLALGHCPLAILLDRAANEVANGLGTIDIAARGDQFIKLPCQRGVKRNGETLHAEFSPGDAPHVSAQCWNGKCLIPDGHPGAAPVV